MKEGKMTDNGKNSWFEYWNGDEAEHFAYGLAGERYDPVRVLSRSQETTWEIPDAIASAEGRGAKITVLHSRHWKTQGGYSIPVMVMEAELGDRTALVLLQGGLRGDFLGDDEQHLAAVAEAFLADAPPVERPAKKKDHIYVSFSYDTPGGNHALTREITAPRWEDVKSNYPGTAGKLDELVTGGPDAAHGHLGVLHGSPGSGKTSFIRSLSRAWQNQAKITYVVDTEAFFRNPGYLLNVILSENGRWHLIICEDAEEFLTEEAKATVGQALSRVLNVGDGMLGQGLRVLILFTTNSKKAQLNEAITRKGRCFLDIELPRFTQAQAMEWLRDHGRTDEEIAEDVTVPDPPEPGRAVHHLPAARGGTGEAGGAGGAGR